MALGILAGRMAEVSVTKSVRIDVMVLERVGISVMGEVEMLGRMKVVERELMDVLVSKEGVTTGVEVVQVEEEGEGG